MSPVFKFSHGNPPFPVFNHHIDVNWCRATLLVRVSKECWMSRNVATDQHGQSRCHLREYLYKYLQTYTRDIVALSADLHRKAKAQRRNCLKPQSSSESLEKRQVVSRDGCTAEDVVQVIPRRPCGQTLWRSGIALGSPSGGPAVACPVDMRAQLTQVNQPGMGQ